MNEDGTVKSHQKIDGSEGGLEEELYLGDRFGSDITSINDLNGDGISDIAVGAWGDDDGRNNSGAVYILFLNSDGTVKESQKISATEGGLVGLTENRLFGIGLTSLGDLDGDGYTDIAVGAPAWDNDGGLYRGAVFVLFLNGDGTVKSQQMLNDVHGNLDIALDNNDRFGTKLQNLGDLNGDGVADLAVHSRINNEGVDTGELYFIYLNTDGTAQGYTQVNAYESGLSAQLNSGDLFGSGVTSCGDLDGDGIADLIVGAAKDDDAGYDAGAIYVLFMNEDATVKNYQKITNNYFTELAEGDHIGGNLEYFGDLNNDGLPEILITCSANDDGGMDRGAFYIVTVDGEILKRAEAIPSSPYILGNTRVSDTQGNFQGTLVDGENFGSAIEMLNDMDGDGRSEFAVLALDAPYPLKTLIFENTGDNTYEKVWTEETITPLWIENEYVGEMFLSDIDSDGKEELVLGGAVTDTSGSEDIHRGRFFIFESVSSYQPPFIKTDLQNDNKYRLTHYFEFEAPPYIEPWPLSPLHILDVITTDLDKDGAKELAFAIWGQVYVIEFDGYQYHPIWYHTIGCYDHFIYDDIFLVENGCRTSMTTGDADQDGLQELIFNDFDGEYYTFSLYEHD